MRAPLPALLVFVVSAWSGCRCPERLSNVEPPRVEASVARLDFGGVYVGATREAALTVQNLGSTTTLELALPAPFAAPTNLTVPRGGTVELQVSFSPRSAGPFDATLEFGSSSVTVLGEGVPLPDCPTGPCQESRFDLLAGTCVVAQRPEGSTCESRCLAGGRCDAAATCVGQSLSCDDGDACTVDACDEARGCVQVPRVCPAPSSPCQVATCDAARGCAFAEVPDGTLCGVDDCLATTASVCLSGRCEVRPRPALARCANRWVPTSLPAGARSGAYDRVRQRLVVLVLGTTWEWDGGRWTQRFPLVAADGLLTWNDARQRVLASTGPESWEWDGTNWVKLATGPGPSRLVSLAYDPVRRVAVALAADSNMTLTTWELGATWRQFSAKPPEQGPLTWDPARRRVVAMARAAVGSTPALWSWDGASWTMLSAIPSSVYLFDQNALGLAFDPLRERIVVSLLDNSGGAQIVEWDGATWTTPPGVNPDQFGLLSWDEARESLVSYAGYQGTNIDPSARTWVRRGLQWQKLTEQRPVRVAAWDAQRRSFLAISEPGESTLEWHDGWTERAPAPLVALSGLAQLPPTGQLIGCNVDVNAGPLMTWAWDGVSWTALSACGPSWMNPFWNPLTQRLTANVGAHSEEWDGTGWSRWSDERFPMPSVYEPATGSILSVTSSVTRSWTPDAGWVDRNDAGPTNARAAVFDPGRQRVLLVATDGVSVISTWEWSASEWTRLSATGGPASTPKSLGFDPMLQRVMLVSGDGTVWALLP